MKEIEKRVPGTKLSIDWLNNSLISFEALKRTISFFNENYSFDLYNNNEDLSPDVLNEKQAIKETCVTLPLTYIMEKFLKATIFFYDVKGGENRATMVKEILNNVKNSSDIKGNLHNALLLIDYIDKNIDNNFISFLAYAYKGRRDGYNDEEIDRGDNETRKMQPRDRIVYATEIYQNAFIDLRYLYERSDTNEIVDLVKLMDYIASIRDISIYLYFKKKILILLDEYDIDKTEMNEFFAKIYSFVKEEHASCIELMHFVCEALNYIPEPKVNQNNELMQFKNSVKKLRGEILEYTKRLENEYKPEFTKKKENSNNMY